ALFHISVVRKMTPFVGLGSFEDYFRNKRLLQRNTKLSAQTLVRLDENLRRIKKEYDRQNEQNVQLTSLRKAKEEQNNLLKFEQQQQFTYLQHIQKDQSTRLRYLREIQVELERLNDVIHLLEQKKENDEKSKQFGGFRNYKNTLSAPVKGKLIHRFGRKHSPFYTLFKRGVLVETSKNDNVRSILPGKVVWSGPFRGYQNLVILDHGKGSLSVYGNLDEVFVIVDDVIDQNYILGTVAYNSSENRYLFYFETRYNKRAVDPVQWLKNPVW
ncbi:peptidoglycan DD-metalloendopeptidase family protein, partial [bacterium]|nr:peptidoglycan DD-metalloendopeptidase family protein [bacterium]